MVIDCYNFQSNKRVWVSMQCLELSEGIVGSRKGVSGAWTQIANMTSKSKGLREK